jgi:hypothetical protein
LKVKRPQTNANEDERVFAELIGFISPSPWPSPARGEGMHGSGTDAIGEFFSASRLGVFDSLEQSVPSPLAGEGQGEGEYNP